jgi:hypothetical protein
LDLCEGFGGGGGIFGFGIVGDVVLGEGAGIHAGDEYALDLFHVGWCSINFYQWPKVE